MAYPPLQWCRVMRCVRPIMWWSNSCIVAEQPLIEHRLAARQIQPHIRGTTG